MSTGEIRIDGFDIGPEQPDETKMAALRTACGYAHDVAEAQVFAKMLGLSPAKFVAPGCSSCGRPMSRKARSGYVTRGAEGMCSTCYSGVVRLRKQEAQ
jgi:hypothetical protein